MAEESFQLYDTTLRDGTQQEGMVLTVEDKLAVARRLDTLGVGFIEGGWPGAVPKDTEACVTPVLRLDEAADHPHQRARGSAPAAPAPNSTCKAPGSSPSAPPAGPASPRRWTRRCAHSWRPGPRW
jgi:hypothetical protein